MLLTRGIFQCLLTHNAAQRLLGAERLSILAWKHALGISASVSRNSHLVPHHHHHVYHRDYQAFSTLCLKKTKQGSSEVVLETASTNDASCMLEVKWAESTEVNRFPYVWLRENCQCPACYDPSTHQKFLFKDLDINVKAVFAKVISNGKAVTVKWSDGHSGTYLASWLHPRAFHPVQRKAREEKIRLKRYFWNSKLLKNVPTVGFLDVLYNDHTLLSWLKMLEVYGFVILTGAPAETEQVKRLTERIMFVRKTHYGETFTVRAKSNPSNAAYASGPLQLHTDLPYYVNKPGVQFIHCIVQFHGEGGESLITDAAAVALYLKETEPNLYRILANTPVDWYDKGMDEGREYFKILRRPVICEDRDGEIARINFSHPQRDSYFAVDADQVSDWYKAMKTFHLILHDPKFCLSFKMEPGMIVSFDNLRIVHGRMSYDASKGDRHLEGCYIDWDEVWSRRRVLEEKLEEQVPVK